MRKSANIVLGCILLFSALSSCNGPVKKGSAGETKTPPEVGVMKVMPAEGISTRSYVGKVAASRSVRLSSRYPGKIESLRVSEGSRIGKGEPVAMIWSEGINSTLTTAQSNYDYARDGLERAEKLHGAGSVTEQKMVELRSEFNKAEASLKAALQAKEECTIRSPFNGVAGEVPVFEGENINPLQTIAVLMDLGTLEIEISVPEAEMSIIKVGETMDVSVPALGGKNFQAKVKSKGISASVASHSYSCILAPCGSTVGLLPGMVCSVRDSKGTGGLFVIPANAVRTDSDGRYVWAVNGSKVEKKRIRVGGYSGDGIAVSEGLAEGDLIIIAGAQKVSTGTEVNVRIEE